MYIDYILLAFVSLAAFVYAYVRRPEGDTGGDDDGDGGLPKSGDSSPTDRPPTVSVPTRDRAPTVPA